MTDCPSSLPSAFSTATEMVSRWTSRPIYFDAIHRVFLSSGLVYCFTQQPQPTAKGAPFYNACPTHSRVSNVWDQESVELLALPLIPKAGMSGAPGRPPFAKNAKDGAPHCVGDASEIKG